MDALRSHIQSHKEQLESLVESLLKLSSNPNKTDEKDLILLITEKRNKFVSLLSSVLFPLLSIPRLNGEEGETSSSSSLSNLVSAAIQEIQTSSPSCSTAATSLILENNCRFILNAWDSIDQIARKAIVEVRPHLIFFLEHTEHSAQSPKTPNLIQVVSPRCGQGTDSAHNGDVDNGDAEKESISLMKTWERLQEQAILQLFYSASLPSSKSTILKTLSSSTSANDRALVYRTFVLEQHIAIASAASSSSSSSCSSCFFSVAIRRSSYREVALVLFNNHFFVSALDSNLETRQNLFKTILTAPKITARARNEVVCLFISLVANSHEALSDPVGTTSRFAKVILGSVDRDEDEGDGEDSGDDGDNDNSDKWPLKWWADTIFINPIKRCTLDRTSIEFLVLGVIPSFSQGQVCDVHEFIATSLFQQVTTLWSHAENREEEQENQQQQQQLSSPSCYSHASPSSFLHSTSSESSWSLVCALTSLLMLSHFFLKLKSNKTGDRENEEHHDPSLSSSSSAPPPLSEFYSLMVFQSTSAILKGVSFRLSALNRLSQKQGALVASLYFEVSELQLKEMMEESKKIKSRRDDESNSPSSMSASTPKAKFDQFPNLLESFVDDERTVWSMVAEVNIFDKSIESREGGKTAVFRDSDHDQTKSARVREMISRKHQALRTGSRNDQDESRSSTLDVLSGNKYWFLCLPERSDTSRRKSLVHPLFHARVTPAYAKTLERKYRVNSEKLNQCRASLMDAVRREIEQRHQLQQQQRQHNGSDHHDAKAIKLQGADHLSTTSSSSSSFSTNVVVVSTLRELETRLTQAETNSAGSANHLNSTSSSASDQKNPMDLGEETMKELPLVLERHFSSKNYFVIAPSSSSLSFPSYLSRENSQLNRSHTSDPSVVVRLFMLSIASTFASVKGECSFAAASAAGWCFALAPGNILLECQKVLNGSDFSLTHKLRVYNAMQVGMARLANTRTVGGGGEPYRRHFVGVGQESNECDDGNDDNLEATVVYPPLPNSNQPFLASTKANQSEGSVRWRSKKLSQEYIEREQNSKSVVYRNEAIPWARQAVEVALLLDGISRDNYFFSDKENLFDQLDAPGAGREDRPEQQQQQKRTRLPYVKSLLERDPDGALILEAIRTVSLISEFVSRSSIMMMESLASVALDSLFSLATQHYLPAVRANSLVCLSSLLKFGDTRRAVLFSSGTSAMDKLTTVLFLSGLAKLAKEDPDATVRFIAKDFADMLMMF